MLDCGEKNYQKSKANTNKCLLSLNWQYYILPDHNDISEFYSETLN